jgi:hypothetical protein
MRPVPSPAVLVVAAVLVACGSDDLDQQTANRVYNAVSDVAQLCGTHDPSPRMVKRGNAGMRTLISQYEKTPDGRAQILESSPTEPMHEILAITARKDRGEPRQCRNLQAKAREALRR